MNDENKEAQKEVVKAKPAQKPRSRTAVRVIRNLGKALLVSYVEASAEKRRVVPLATLDPDGTIDDESLKAGIPYGIPWAKLPIILKASLETFEREMHNADIWTLEDAMKRPQAVFGALQKTYQLDYAAILEAAAAFMKEQED